MLADIHNSVIRDNIEGNRLIEAPDAIRRIVDAREFQRLRSVRQMGLSYFVFPTAEHLYNSLIHLACLRRPIKYFGNCNDDRCHWTSKCPLSSTGKLN